MFTGVFLPNFCIVGCWLVRFKADRIKSKQNKSKCLEIVNACEQISIL